MKDGDTGQMLVKKAAQEMKAVWYQEKTATSWCCRDGKCHSWVHVFEHLVSNSRCWYCINFGKWGSAGGNESPRGFIDWHHFPVSFCSTEV